MKTEYIWREGDEFKIKPENVTNRYKCRYPNKTFIIKKITNNFILYKDNRTNIKCLCSQCRKETKKHWSYTEKESIDTGLKEVLKDKIVLVRTKSQRQRDISLKILNI